MSTPTMFSRRRLVWPLPALLAEICRRKDYCSIIICFVRGAHLPFSDLQHVSVQGTRALRILVLIIITIIIIIIIMFIIIIIIISSSSSSIIVIFIIIVRCLGHPSCRRQESLQYIVVGFHFNVEIQN